MLALAAIDTVSNVVRGIRIVDCPRCAIGLIRVRRGAAGPCNTCTHLSDEECASMRERRWRAQEFRRRRSS
jgi:hypothetical protein